MKLERNFTLHELTYSETALRHGIGNTPTQEEIIKLGHLAKYILQPVRDKFGQSVHVSSGFRCTALNNIVSKSPNSQHTKAEAVDFEIFGVDNKELAWWIADNLVFDQLVLEYYNEGEINSGWVHCSFKLNDNRMEQLTVTKNGRRHGPI